MNSMTPDPGYDPFSSEVLANPWPAYARLRRPMTLGVRGLVENSDGQILLVRHTYISGWHMPGGGVERGEPCIESLRREVEEEGGILLNGTPSMVGMFSNHTSFPNDHVLLYHVPAQIWTQGKATAVARRSARLPRLGRLQPRRRPRARRRGRPGSASAGPARTPNGSASRRRASSRAQAASTGTGIQS